MGPADLVAGIAELASPPEIYSRITALLDDPASSLQDFADVLQEDPGLTARLLRIVNSAYYGFPSQVSTVSRAITLVGTRELRDLTLATSVLEMFDGIPNELVTMRSFWEESLRCAVFAKVIAARHEQGATIESIFIAGLLHEVGHLLMYRKIPELAREAMLLQRQRSCAAHMAEREVMGFDYAAVGAALLRKWRLPDVLCDPVEHHVDPVHDDHFSLESRIVHVARRLSLPGTFDIVDLGRQLDVRDPMFKSIGMREGMLEMLLQETEEQFGEMRAVFI